MYIVVHKQKLDHTIPKIFFVVFFMKFCFKFQIFIMNCDNYLLMILFISFNLLIFDMTAADITFLTRSRGCIPISFCTDILMISFDTKMYKKDISKEIYQFGKIFTLLT